MDDTILYGSCFDANGGLFETLLDGAGRHHLDELNHASIIDGVRLCKATRIAIATAIMDDLEAKLKESASGAGIG
jgi:glycine C-acetyltransferase